MAASLPISNITDRLAMQSISTTKQQPTKHQHESSARGKPRRRHQSKQSQQNHAKTAAASGASYTAGGPLRLHHLNDDVLLHIFAMCPNSDLLNLNFVCPRFKELIGMHILPRRCRNLLMTNTQRLQSAHALRTSARPTLFERVRISECWLLGRYTEHSIFQHRIMYPTYLHLEQDTLYTSNAGQIRRHHRTRHVPQKSSYGSNSYRQPLDAKPYQCFGREDDADVTCFRVRDGTLFGGRADGHCFVHDVLADGAVRDMYETCTLGTRAGEPGIRSTVAAVDMRGACYATANRHRLTLWTRSTELGQPLLEPLVEVHEEYKALAFQAPEDGDWLACGRYCDRDRTALQLLHAERHMRRTLNSRTTAVYDLRWLDANVLLTANYDSTCRLHDLRANADVCTWMDPYDAAVYTLEHDGQYGVLAGMSAHCRVNMYDVRQTRAPVQMIYPRMEGHRCGGRSAWKDSGSPVYGLACDQTQLFIATDHNLRVLDFETWWAQVRDYREAFSNVVM